MKVLILCGKKTSEVKKLKKSFESNGIETIYLNIGKLSLLSKENKTFIKNSGMNVEEFDAVFLRTGLKLAPFVEPLLDELRDRKIFVQISPSAYFSNANEALQLLFLSKCVKVPKFLILSTPKRIRGFIYALHYPLMFKTFIGLKKTQSIIVESPRSLSSIAKSVKAETDAVILREFIEGDLIQCTVIGEQVFSIKRKWKKNELQKLETGKKAIISPKLKKLAITAVNCCGLQMGTVKICKGYVTDVSNEIDFDVFSKKSGKDLYKITAEFFKEKIKLNELSK